MTNDTVGVGFRDIYIYFSGPVLSQLLAGL